MYPNVVYYQTVGDDLCGDTGVLSVLVPHRMCVFNIYIVDTDENSYDGIHTQFFCLSTSGTKRPNILSLDLSNDSTSRRLCSLWMRLGGRRKRFQLNNWLLPCKSNETVNTWQHVGMYRFCILSACWCGGHGAAEPLEQDVCLLTAYLVIIG